MHIGVIKLSLGSFMLFSAPKKEEKKEEYDVVIIGGGPAGLTAGLYAGRYGLSALIITQTLGGLVAEASVIENYPGFESITGTELVEKFQKQTLKWGAQINIAEEVIDIKKREDGKFDVISDRDKYIAKTVIIATGTKHKRLNVPGELELEGKGVSYCATCDAPFFKDKVVAVIGGGNTAVMDTLYLGSICKKIYLVHRRDKLRAEKALVNRLDELKNLEIIWNHVVDKIEGQENVEKIILKNKLTGEIKELKVDGVFVDVGILPNSELPKKIGIKLDKAGYVEVDRHMNTNIEGIYAAGDITGNVGQIAVAVGEGTIAATSAFEYIQVKYGV